MVTPPFWFSHYEHLCVVQTGHLLTAIGGDPSDLNTSGVYKFHDFCPVSGYMWETV